MRYKTRSQTMHKLAAYTAVLALRTVSIPLLMGNDTSPVLRAPQPTVSQTVTFISDSPALAGVLALRRTDTGNPFVALKRALQFGNAEVGVPVNPKSGTTLSVKFTNKDNLTVKYVPEDWDGWQLRDLSGSVRLSYRHVF